MNEIIKDENGQWNPEINDADVYRFITTYWLYQDQLSWGRIKGLITVEAGALAAAITKGGFVAVGVLSIACLFIVFTRRLIIRDWQIRDQNEHFLAKIHAPRGIVMEVDPPNKWWSGGFILTFMFYFFLITNLVLMIYYVFNIVA